MRPALLLFLLSTSPALGQSADCEARLNGPAMPLMAHRQGAYIDLGNVPANGTICGDDAVLPDDVLHGAPAPHGLLRGDGPRDVLHNRPDSHVTVTPMPNAPPP